MRYLFFLLTLFSCSKNHMELQPDITGTWTMREVESFDPFNPNTLLVFNDCGFLTFNDDQTGEWRITYPGLEYEYDFYWSVDSLIHIENSTSKADYRILYQSADSMVINELIVDSTNYLGLPFDKDPGLKLFLSK